MGLGQTSEQRKTEWEIVRLTDLFSKRLGMTRRAFLQTGCGMATAFLAMNSVYGTVFTVEEAEASDRGRAEERDAALSKQFIFDVQLHFVRDEYAWEPLPGLRRYARRFNPRLKEEELSLELFRFHNFVREVFLESQTTLGLLSGAPSDDPDRWFLRNDEIAEDLRDRHGFAPLGAADGLVKNALFGYNAARLYGIRLESRGSALEFENDRFARLKGEYRRY